MKITILRHTDGTPPGAVIDWLERRKSALQYEVRQLHKGDPLPALHETDWLIVLGGGMNVDQTAEHPWLVQEKELLKTAVREGKTCFGICLGGQMLAQTLGAPVRKHTHWEVGWHKVELENHGPLTVFQFHQDTFGLPPGARRIGTNSITENQAFAFGDHVIGLQFHPEATQEWVRECAEDKEDYPSGAHVQTPSALIEGARTHIPPMREWLFSLLDQLERRTRLKIGAAPVSSVTRL